MFWRYNSTLKVRELEDKNLLKVESDNFRAKVAMEPTLTTKQSTIMILKGVLFAITLTGFEYTLKNFEVTRLLRTIFQIGFFSSLLGVGYVPYGIYNLIKSF